MLYSIFSDEHSDYWTEISKVDKSNDDFQPREVSIFDICQIQNDENRFSYALKYFMERYPNLWCDFFVDKWNIKYINLASDEYNNILRVEEKTYLPDYLHLNRAGYEVVSPYIYDFMQTLDKYQ